MIAPLESILFLTVPSMIHPLETSEFSTSAVSLKRVGGVSFTFVRIFLPDFTPKTSSLISDFNKFILKSKYSLVEFIHCRYPLNS